MIEKLEILRTWRWSDDVSDWLTTGYVPASEKCRWLVRLNDVFYVILTFGKSGCQSRIPIPLSEGQAMRVFYERPETGGYPTVQPDHLQVTLR